MLMRVAKLPLPAYQHLFLRISGMRQVLVLALSALASMLFLAPVSASDQGGPETGNALSTPPKLTVLYDAFGRDPGLQKDWGYAALIEIGGRRILFDTGNDSGVFAHNVNSLGIDLTTLDFVVLSHRHGDHTTGLTYLLSVNPDVQIYAPNETFGVFGSAMPSTFYRKEPTLAPEMRYFGGSPPESLPSGKAWPGARIALINRTTEVAPGVHLIALVSDKAGTLEMRELSLAIETPEGMVVVVGCSHPGIERIVAEAAKINPRIHIIAGGLHLVASSDAEIARLTATLRDTYGVAWIAAGHCTGEPAFAALSRHFGDRNVYAGLGTTIGLGANPRAALDPGRRYALSADDLMTYRAVMRNSLLRFGRPPRARP